MNSRLFARLAAALLFVHQITVANAQGTAFNYQGQLNISGAPANGRYDFQFAVFDSSSGGAQQGGTLSVPALGVTNGLFTLNLDFGNIFGGGARWLSIAVKTNGAATYTLLAPRQELTPTPYAINAASASGVRAGGITAAMLGTGVVTSNSVAAGAITADKIAPGAVTTAKIDDGGLAQFEEMQRQTFPFSKQAGTDFANLSALVITNASAPLVLFSIDGLTFGTVTGFAANEAMSEPFSVVVHGHSTSIQDPDTRIGSIGRLTFTRNGRTSSMAGSITAFGLSSSNSTRRFFSARIQPVMVYAERTSDYQVFQEQTIPDVLQSLLALHGGSSSYELRLNASYAPRAMTVQYGETDLNFINRLMEETGIFYFFEHSTTTAPLMVLADANSATSPSVNPNLTYYGDHPTASIPAGAEHITTFRKVPQQSTLRHVVRNYSPQVPQNTLEGIATAARGVGENYDFGSPVKSSANSLQLARLAAGREEVARATVSGSSSAPDLHPGYRITITDQTASGLGGEYLITRVRHGGFLRAANGTNQWLYGNEFEAIPATIAFRPALKTPKPRAGLDTATITGPAGETVHTDGYGRVKALFHWDRTGTRDERSSAFIPMAMPSAGLNHTMLFLPRVGDQVVVSFLRGDPDEPIIVGSIFHANGLPPYALPDTKFLNVIQTRSSDGTINRLRMDDTAGASSVTIDSPRINLNGNVSINGLPAVSRMLSGQLTAGTSASAQASYTISFGRTFTTPPRVIVTPQNDPNFSNVTDTFSVTIRSVGVSSCVVNVRRTDLNGGWDQSLRLNWMILD